MPSLSQEDQSLFGLSGPALADPAAAQPAGDGPNLIDTLSNKYGLPSEIAHAMMSTEGSRADQVSPKGASGRFQVMPAVLKQYMGIDDPMMATDDQKTEAGIKKLADDYRWSGGNAEKTAAAYIGGRGGAAAWENGMGDDIHDGTPEKRGTSINQYVDRFRTKLAKVRPQIAQVREAMAAPKYSAYPTYSNPSEQGVSDPMQEKSIWGDLPNVGVDVGMSHDAKAQSKGSAFAHGFKEAFQQVPQLLYGTAAYLGDVLGNDWLKKNGLELAEAKAKQIGAEAQPYQDVQDAWRDGAMGKWFGYALGYSGAQLVQALGTGGVGALAGKIGLKTLLTSTATRAASEAMASGAAKAAAVKMGVTEAVAAAKIGEQAAALAGAKFGGAAAMAGNSEVMEIGQVYPDAVEEAARTGTPVDLTKIGLASTLAASLDVLPEMRIGGKILGSGGKALTGAAYDKALKESERGLLNRVGREVPKQMALEGGTEGIQTPIETWGAGKDPSSPEAIRDAINSAAMGAVGGLVGGIGAGLPKSTVPAQAPAAAQTEIAGSPLTSAHNAAQNHATGASPVPQVDTEIPAYMRQSDNAATDQQGWAGYAQISPIGDPHFDGAQQAVGQFFGDFRNEKKLEGLGGIGPDAIDQARHVWTNIINNPDAQIEMRKKAIQDATSLIERVKGNGEKFTMPPVAPQQGNGPSSFTQPARPQLTAQDDAIQGQSSRVHNDGAAALSYSEPAKAPLRALPTLQESIQARADYDQAYQDLVKAEQLGLADNDLMQRQMALQGAEARLREISMAVAANREQETAGKRNALLDSVLEGMPKGQNPLRAFGRALQTDRFSDTDITEQERQKISRWQDLNQTFTADEHEPSTPNEMDPGLVKEKVAPTPRQARAKVAENLVDAWLRRKGIETTPEIAPAFADADGNVMTAKAEESTSDPTALAAPVLSERDQAMAQVAEGIDELIALLGGKLNMMPEEESRIIPIMSRLFRAAAKLGYLTFKDSARWLMNQIRGKSQVVADKISIEILQAGFVDVAKTIGRDRREVLAVDSIDELTGDSTPGKATQGEIPGESDTPKQSTRASAQDIRAAFLQAFGSRSIRQLEANGLSNILATAAGLPAAIRVSPSAKAVFVNGRAYFIADRISPSEAPSLLLHEIGEHYGLENVLGADGYQHLVNRITELAKAGDEHPAAAWAYVRNNYPELKEGDSLFMHEVLAQIGQNADVAQKSWFHELVASFKRFLLKMGFTGMIRVSDLQDMVLHSLRSAAIRDGGAMDAIRGSQRANEATAMASTLESRGNYFDQYASIGGQPVVDAIKQKIADTFNTKRTFNSWWHTKVGTQYHKAEIDPQHFGPVFKLAQKFIDDTARYANMAADMAPGLIPNVNSVIDAVKGIASMKSDAADAKAISSPIFSGTLDDKVFTDDELRQQFGLNAKQIGLYHQYLAAVNKSLDGLAISEMRRLAKASDLRLAPEGLSLREAAEFYQDQYRDDLDATIADLKELQETQAFEKKALDDAADEQASGADDAKRYGKLLTAMNKRHSAEMQAIKDKLANLTHLQDGFMGKADQIERMKENGYAPLMRFGRYTVDVFLEGMDEEGNPTGRPVKDAHGDEIRHAFLMFEDESQANKAARALRDEYPDAKIKQGILSERASDLFQKVGTDTLEILARTLDAEMTDAFQAYLKLATNNRSAMRRLIERKKIAGFSDDAVRTLASFITSNARLSSANDHFGDMLKAAAAIPKEKGDVHDEAVDLLKYVQNPVEEASKLRGLLFMNYLGGSVASALVNMTQPILMTFPYLNQFSPKAASILASSMGLASRHMFGKEVNIADTALRDAMLRAEKEGVTNPQEIHMLQGEAGRSGLFQNNRALRNLTKVWGSLFSLAESFNRYSTFMAAFKIAQELGLDGLENAYQKAAALATKRGLAAPSRDSFTDPYEFAKKAVYDTQGLYNKANRPNWGRGAIGATIFTFKQFSIAYLEFLKRLPARERAIALSVLMLAAGTQGLPGADDLDDLIDTIAQSLGYSFNSKQEKRDFIGKILGRDAAGFISYGISYGLPLDVAGRMSAGNLLPGTALFKRSETDRTRDVAEFFGAAGGLAQNVMHSVEAAQAGSAGGAIVAILPKAFSDAYKAYDMAMTGKYHDTKGRVVTDVDALDAAIKAIGFQPAHIAHDSRERSITQQNIDLLRAVQRDITDDWAHGVFEHDPARISDARAKLAAWNTDNPDEKIVVKSSTVQKLVRQMGLTANQRFIKASPKQMKQEIASALTQ